MRQLVNQAQLRGAFEDRRQVHLLKPGIAVVHASPRHHLEAVGLRCGLGPVVRLEVADHRVDSAVGLGPALLEHPVRLADSGGHSKKYLVTAAHAHRAKW